MEDAHVNGFAHLSLDDLKLLETILNSVNMRWFTPEAQARRDEFVRAIQFVGERP